MMVIPTTLTTQLPAMSQVHSSKLTENLLKMLVLEKLPLKKKLHPLPLEKAKAKAKKLPLKKKLHPLLLEKAKANKLPLEKAKANKLPLEKVKANKLLEPKKI